MLLVDHQQAELGKLDVALQQTVGADDDIDSAAAHVFDDLLVFLE